MRCVHGKPRLDGVSGFVTPATRRLRLSVQDFPSPAAIAAPRTLEPTT